MKKILPFLLAALSGVVLALPQISSLPGIIVLVAYIPLLWAEASLTREDVRKPGLKVFGAAFLCFFFLNALPLFSFYKLLSYWIFLYILYVSVLYSFIFLLFSIVKRKTAPGIGYASWIFFTIALEFFILNANFAFSALLNGALLFDSDNAYLIQWYEYTGMLGGSVWVLLCNLMIFTLIGKWLQSKNKKQNWIFTALTAVCIFLPVFCSVFRYHTYEEKEDPMEVVVVQPNIDPYTEKFTIGYDVQLDTMLALSRRAASPQTEYILFPETALDSNIWLNNIRENYMVLKIKDSLLADYPRAKVITGVDMMQYYVVSDGKAPTATARKADERIYYDFFNAAIQIDATGDVQAYKKSKLVLGTEYVPFVKTFPRLQEWSMKLGGSAQSRGRQDKPSLMLSEQAKVASVICYESLFGEYVADFVKLGAEAIFIITNDGWWDRYPIPEVHLRFAQIRAIENRRSVVRCANTGISAYVNQRGDILTESDWWVREAFKEDVNKNKELTFYTVSGDYIGRICVAASLMVLLSFVLKLWKDSRKRKLSD